MAHKRRAVNYPLKSYK